MENRSAVARAVANHWANKFDKSSTSDSAENAVKEEQNGGTEAGKSADVESSELPIDPPSSTAQERNQIIILDDDETPEQVEKNSAPKIQPEGVAQNESEVVVVSEQPVEKPKPVKRRTAGPKGTRSRRANTKRSLDTSGDQPAVKRQKGDVEIPVAEALVRKFSPVKLLGIPSPEVHNDGCMLLKDILANVTTDTYQFNMMVDMKFFASQLPKARRNSIKVHIIADNHVDLTEVPDLNVSVHYVEMQMYASHHTKLMINKVENGGIQIIVSTANLVTMNYYGMTEMFWMSPVLYKMKNEGSGEPVLKPNNSFKQDFIHYLRQYDLSQIPISDLISELQEYDFSAIRNTEFISSAPGSFQGSSSGYGKLYQRLKDHDLIPPHRGPFDPPAPVEKKPLLVAQVSSIAQPFSPYKMTAMLNIFTHLLCPLMTGLPFPTLQQGFSTADFTPAIVFPTLENIEQSFIGKLSGSAIFYNHTKGPRAQKHHQMLKPYLYKWKSEKAKRQNVPPHVKTYFKTCDNCETMDWFLLTSANLSKQAWGQPHMRRTAVMKYNVASYEAGVLIFPDKEKNEKLVPISGDYIDVRPTESIVPIRLPYDVPLTKYGENDVPWDSAFLKDEDLDAN